MLNLMTGHLGSSKKKWRKEIRNMLLLQGDGADQMI